MFSTEDEAKTKWCPMVRQSATFTEGYGLSYNRSAVEVPPDCRCVGSACMMWRQTLVELHHGVGTAGPFTVPAGSGWCGLAGRPE